MDAQTWIYAAGIVATVPAIAALFRRDLRLGWPWAIAIGLLAALIWPLLLLSLVL
jgi:hypothetical protein